MAEYKNYITTQGHARIRKELHDLLYVDRPRTTEEVSVAAAHGDRSENAEYIYGKKKLRALDRRIYYLTKRLDAAVVVDPAEDRGDRVFFGATVTLEAPDGVEQTYQLVGEDEIEPDQHRISWRSPLGQALIGRQLDDDIQLVTPGGYRLYTITDVRYG